MNEQYILTDKEKYVSFGQEVIKKTVKKFKDGECSDWILGRSISTVLELANARYKMDLMEFDIPTDIKVDNGVLKGYEFVAITSKELDQWSARGIRYDFNEKNVKGGEILLSDFIKQQNPSFSKPQ